MDKKEWVSAWQEGRTNFHVEGPNPFLTKCYEKIGIPKDASVLVPMCGKTHDLLWLQSRGHAVYGVEIVEHPCVEFWKEHNLSHNEENVESAKVYRGDKITIINDDFFKFPRELLPKKLDLIYDRAALVALPPPMRETYYQRIKELASAGTKILLSAFSYDRKFETRAPYSVSQEEIRAAYTWVSRIDILMHEQREVKQTHLAQRGIQEVIDTIYLMTV